jgi:hypothetical protein
MIKVYIASPYANGDTAINVKRQIDAGDALISNGFAPFIPLLYHFQHLVHPRPNSDWMNIDLEWVKACDALLRLPGISDGADQEVDCAKQNGIPVFYNLEDLIKFFHEKL